MEEVVDQSIASVFTKELTNSQLAAIQNLLPKGYSFQFCRPVHKRIPTAQVNSGESRPIPPKSQKQSSKQQITKYDTLNLPLTSRYSTTVQSQEISQKMTAVTISDELKPCLKILQLLKNSKHAWPFRLPVNPVQEGIPHYKQIVKQPMDLTTIENNLMSGSYVISAQFHADINKIIQNSYLFNAANPHYTLLTTEFENYYNRIIGKITDTMVSNSSHINSKNEPLLKQKIQLKNSKSKDSAKSQNYVVTNSEIKQLITCIQRLPKEHLKGVRDIINEGQLQPKDDLNLMTLPPAKISILQTYVTNKLRGLSSDTLFNKSKQQDQQEQSSFDLDEDDS